MAEYAQIDDKIVFEPLMASKLSRNEQKKGVANDSTN